MIAEFQRDVLIATAKSSPLRWRELVDREQSSGIAHADTEGVKIPEQSLCSPSGQDQPLVSFVPAYSRLVRRYSAASSSTIHPPETRAKRFALTSVGSPQPGLEPLLSQAKRAFSRDPRQSAAPDESQSS